MFYHYLYAYFSLGEGCSHVAAILFKIESAVRLGYTSVTSQEYGWNETFCSKVSCLKYTNVYMTLISIL